MVSAAYPNPVMKGDQVKVDLFTYCPKTVKMTVYTMANRKVYEEALQVRWKTTAFWNLRDDKGAKVANGNYYIHFTGRKGWVPVAVTR
jgi:flagellar hook assembly protein FlgD